MSGQRPLSRFAFIEEVMTAEFMQLVRILDHITVDFQLPDHSDVNQARYPWSVGLLSSPSLYAARMWEYPFAILSAELQPGMKCVDVGCGMTAFTIYLKDVAECEVVGVDPDMFRSGIKYKGHGVSLEFIKKTGLKIIRASMEKIPLPPNSFDRVFCLSVMEHLPSDIAKRGMQEIARILKPGGRAIITVDVNMFSEISRPLDLIWDSGLSPLGEVDLRWPFRRFGMFCDGKQPADVFGMTLVKDDYSVETTYTEVKGTAPLADAYLVPTLRKENLLISRWHYRLQALWNRLPNIFRMAIERIGVKGILQRILSGNGT